MYGSKVIYDRAAPSESSKLAEAFDKVISPQGAVLKRVGTRNLWEYPAGGSKAGNPVTVGNLKLNYVVIYHDGRGIFLYLAGQNPPRRDDDLRAMHQALKVTIRSQHTDLVAGTQV